MSRIVGRRPSRVKARYFAARAGDLATCAIVEAELRFGAAKADDPVRQLAAIKVVLDKIPILPFDSLAAREYGNLRLTLARAGTTIGPNDLMIASIALAHNLILVTHNVDEFSRVPGLTVEDWEA